MTTAFGERSEPMTTAFGERSEPISDEVSPLPQGKPNKPIDFITKNFTKERVVSYTLNAPVFTIPEHTV